MTGARRGLPLLLGVGLALPFAAVLTLHPDLAWDLLALLLALGAGVRLGADAGTAPPPAAAVLGAAVLTALALVSFFWSPLWLAPGLAALAAWSFAAHRRRPERGVLPFGTAWALTAALLVLWYGVP